MTATLGYAMAGTGDADLEQQVAELCAAGVDSRRIFTDRHPGPADKMRAGLVALLSYARTGDVVVVAALQQLGRTATEVSRTVADLDSRGITVRCLRSGVDTATDSGRMVARVLTDLATLD
ncbi:recombinase family protein [Mycolicibacterium vaccae]|uniref:recombinase family protein n=1 Tax=Mycolicibacterium vaccae TaxID=1810 RepID=UPI003CFCC894